MYKFYLIPIIGNLSVSDFECFSVPMNLWVCDVEFEIIQIVLQ